MAMIYRSLTGGPLGKRLFAAAGLAVLVAATVLAAVVGIGAAQSGGVVAGFEIEGNRVLDDTANEDWASVSPQVSVQDSGNMFRPGQSAKEANWQNWAIRSRENVPPKNDITRVQAYTKQDRGDAWLFVNFDRVRGVGDANLAFEFNQVAGWPPQRRSGDLLINYFYTGGGSDQVRLEAFRWTGSSWGTPANVDTAAAISGDRKFGEGGLNLSQFIGATGADPCEPFANVHVRSRSSGSTRGGASQDQRQAQLKDLVGPFGMAFDLCPDVEPEFDIAIEPLADENLVDNPHTFTVTVTRTDTGQPVQGVNPTVTKVSGPGTLSNDTCATAGTDADGECSVDLTSSEVGESVVRATFAGQIDQTQVDLTTEPDDGHKDWVDYGIEVTPAEAVNPVGEEHTFTVELTRFDPDNPSGTPAAGESIDLDLGGTVGEFVSINGSPASGTAGDCDTDGDGRCEVVINADGPGTATLTATYEAAVGDTTGTFTDAGDKEYVEGEHVLRLRPVADENLVGTDHVLTVTLLEIGDGGATTPIEGASPEVAILSGPGALSDDTCATTGTDSDGECTVTLTSSEVGQTVLQATFAGQIDQTQVDLTSNEATKDWVDYAIDVTPPEAVNATGTTHEFTVELTRLDPDDPSGAPAGGEDVDLTLDGVGEIVEIDGAAASGTTGTCTTASDGTCSVVITSDDVGDSTLTATFNAVVGETTGEFSDSGDKEWREPGILLVKNAEIEPNDEGLKVIECPGGVCEDTTYTFTVTNTGDVPFTITDLEDDQFGTIDVDDTELEPGDITQGTVTHTWTEAEVAEGDHENVAVVTAVTDEGQTLTDEDDEIVFFAPILGGLPEIDIVKNAEITPDGEGRKIVECTEAEGCPDTTFTFTVTNVGDTPLVNITVSDDKFGDIDLAETSLEPGESTVGTATYVPTAAEIDAGEHENLATAEGESPDGIPTRDRDDERVVILEVSDVPPEEPPVHPRTGPIHLMLLVALGGLSIASGAGGLLLRRRLTG